MRVLLIDPIDPSGEDILRPHVEILHCKESSPDGIRRDSQDADAVITRSRLPDDFFDFARKIKAITIHGTGTDLVPLESATAHGVAVAHLPGSNAQSVAEYCVMAMLVLSRNLVEISNSVRTKPWDEARALGARAREIAGKTAGVVGVGQIGGRVAKILRNGFGMRVLGHQRRLERLPPEAEPVSLDVLVGSSDFIVLSCPLTDETRHLFNGKRISAMKTSAWLINVGRGAVVEEAALVEALREKRIAGAMLDVYEHYRLEPGHPLFALDNVILTPHLSAMTRESRGRMGVLAAEETLRMLAGERPRHLVNPQAWEAFKLRSSK